MVTLIPTHNHIIICCHCPYPLHTHLTITSHPHGVTSKTICCNQCNPSRTISSHYEQCQLGHPYFQIDLSYHDWPDLSIMLTTSAVELSLLSLLQLWCHIYWVELFKHNIGFIQKIYGWSRYMLCYWAYNPFHIMQFIIPTSMFALGATYPSPLWPTHVTPNYAHTLHYAK